MLEAFDRFKSSKGQIPTGKVVQDLDAIIEDSYLVKLHGKYHEVKPVLVDEFFKLANAFAAISDIGKAEKVTLSELVDGYHGVINSVCPTITKEDIRASSQSQIAALMQQVMDHTSGKMTEEKKKTMTMMSIPKNLKG